MTSFLCFSCIDAADKGVVQVPPSTPHVTRHSRCASLLDMLRLPAVIHVGCSGLAAALLARFLFGSVSLRLQLKHGLTGMRQVQRPRRPRMLVPHVAHAGTYRAVPTASLQPTDTIIFPARLQTVTPVSMQTRQIDVNTNTKTSDNVTVSVKTAIMYHVDPENVQTFYFKLHNPHQQITAYVDDCIRSQVHRDGLGCPAMCVNS
jgi:hypothetical protein